MLLFFYYIYYVYLFIILERLILLEGFHIFCMLIVTCGGVISIGMIVGESSQGINVVGISILKVVSLIPFVRCGRLIKYMLFFTLYLYTYHFIVICIYYYNFMFTYI